jgi:hypothetical protein
VTEESERAQLEELGPELFARECLCVWDAEEGTVEKSVIDTDIWAALAEPGEIVGKPAFAVDVTPDREWCSIAAAGRREDGKPQVELVAHQRGTDWAVARLAELHHKWKVPVAVDPGSPAGSLIADLTLAKVKVETANARDVVQACGDFYDAAVHDRKLRHLGDPLLTAAVAGAKKRALGDAWAWDRRNSSVVISPLVAATLALWAWNARSGSRVLFV